MLPLTRIMEGAKRIQPGLYDNENKMIKIGQKPINETLFKFYVGLDIDVINEMLLETNENTFIYILESHKILLKDINILPKTNFLFYYSCPENLNLGNYINLMDICLKGLQKISTKNWEPISGINLGKTNN